MPGRWMLVAVLLGGCGAAAADVAISPTTSRATGALPTTCVAPAPTGVVGGALSPEIATQLYAESAPVVAHVVCGCARRAGVYAPGSVRVGAVLVPGQGRMTAQGIRVGAGARDADDWPAFVDCVSTGMSEATLPVHVIGSDVVPDADPSDERVLWPMEIALR